MKKYLITGTNSGLGKFLHENIPNSDGLHRNNFNEIKNNSYDVIVNCAFNKELEISNYKQYLNDNILLNLNLKKIKHQKYVYISSIDVYSESKNNYSEFKKFSEALMSEDDLILRCSVLLGKYMKPNHVIKIKNNSESITLSKESTFNYISYDDIFKFISNLNINSFSGVIDFVSNNFMNLEEVVQFYDSKTQLGNYKYNSDYIFSNPIYNLLSDYNKSSQDVLRGFDAI